MSSDLRKLRERVLEEIVPLLETSGAPAEERLQVALQIASVTGKTDMYGKAFEIAQSIESEDKLDIYFDLLARIDAAIQNESEGDELAVVELDEEVGGRSQAADTSVKPIVVN